MIRYVIVLLALNIYTCSLGASIMHNSLEKVLNDLSTSCGNSFLSQQITERIKDCNETIPPYKEKQLQCLMFYDINQHLCSVLSSKTSFKFSLADINNLNGNQSVSDLCNGATKLWKFNNIDVYPNYKSKIESILNNVTCIRLCSENDLSSLNSNFYCKYYKWGSDLLRSMDTSTVNTKIISNGTINNYHSLRKPSSVSPSTTIVNETHSLEKENLQDKTNLKQNSHEYNLNANNTQEILSVPHSKSSVSNVSNQSSFSESSINQNSTLSDVEKLSTTVLVKEANDSNATLKQETSTNPESKTTQKQELLSKILKMYKEFKEESDTGGPTLNVENIQPLQANLNSSRNPQVIEKQPVPLQNPSLPNTGLPSQGVKLPSQKFGVDDLDVYDSDLNVEAEVEQPPSFSPDDSLNDPDADEDSEFSKDTEMKIPYPHDDSPQKDPEVKVGGEPKQQAQETKIEAPLSSLHGDILQKGLNIEEGSEPKQQLKYIESKIEAPLSSLHSDNSQREFSAQEQEGFPEEDDNFFPFFLTGIILVVLLYVFYHNKNRILGLIVEGRQSNRRRNSRGHSYRRLDTLEQAMSGGSGATPPSKIIY